METFLCAITQWPVTIKPGSHMSGKSPAIGDLGVSQSSPIFAIYENINRGFTRLSAIVRDKIGKMRKRFYFPDGSPMISEFCDSCRQMRTQYSFIGDIGRTFYTLPSPFIAYWRKATWQPHSKKVKTATPSWNRLRNVQNKTMI